MHFLKKAVATTALLALSFTASGQQLIQNGGFESGDFTGWTATNQGTGSCATDWTVGTSGSATGCTSVADPFEGDFAAYNSFDGAGPLEYRLSQTVSLPSGITSAELAWVQSYALSIFSGASPRTFNVLITDADDATVHGTVSSQSFSGSESSGGEWEQFNEDVTSVLEPLGGSTVNVVFVNVIPESFTGPAGFGLDAVSLTVEATPPAPVEPTAIPSLSSLGILLLALIMAGIAYGRFGSRHS